MRADVAIIGAGPAGAALACALARRGVDVALIDAAAANAARRRIGENLPPAARPWLAHYGLDDAAHLRTRGLRLVWGSARARWNDHLYSTHGPGLIVDRARFDTDLVDIAVRAGARRLPGTRCTGAVASAEGWRVTLQRTQGNISTLDCRFVAAASGRAAGFAHRAGAVRERHDRLVALVHVAPARTRTEAAYASLEAVADGWWYDSPLPSHEHVTIFFAESDAAPDDEAWRARLADRGVDVDATTRPWRCAANGARVRPVSGANWLAVGDAAQAYDPLASAGLMKALVHGRAASEAIVAALAGDARPLENYAALLDREWDEYRAGLAAHYGLERRYAYAPFWRRRHAPANQAAAIALPRLSFGRLPPPSRGGRPEMPDG